MDHAPASICGENPIFTSTRLGCGERIETCVEVYRCTDCAVPFHRECARRHFGNEHRTMIIPLAKIVGHERPYDPKEALCEACAHFLRDALRAALAMET